MIVPNGRRISRFRCWHITSIPGLIGRAAIEGKRTTLRYREDARPRGVVQDRRSAQICRLERVAGCGIIGNSKRVVPIFIDRGAPLYELARRRAIFPPLNLRTPPNCLRIASAQMAFRQVKPPGVRLARSVRDVDRSEAFYEKVFGLRKLYRYGDLSFFDPAGRRSRSKSTTPGRARGCRCGRPSEDRVALGPSRFRT